MLIILLTFLLSFSAIQTKQNQSLLTTTIGAYPKPHYVKLPNWFQDDLSLDCPSKAYDDYLQAHKNGINILDKATHEVVKEQVNAGIDIVTDGEIRRENYIYYHCRHLNGIDFTTLTKKEMRNGAWIGHVPTITQAISVQEPFLTRDYTVAQQATERPVKITLPGPMTITDTIADAYYYDDEKLGDALAQAINKEVLRLVEAGCTWIQIDEPLFARKPEQALAYGIKNLERCFKGVPEHVTKAVHMCCGYPTKLDDEEYPKANPQAYRQLACTIDASCIDAISLEDAHRRNDPSLFGLFKNTTVILGVIDICSSHVETVTEIKQHIKEVLKHIDAERLIIAPDCGLGMLPHTLVLQKLSNMVEAVQELKSEMEFI